MQHVPRCSDGVSTTMGHLNLRVRGRRVGKERLRLYVPHDGTPELRLERSETMPWHAGNESQWLWPSTRQLIRLLTHDALTTLGFTVHRLQKRFVQMNNRAAMRHLLLDITVSVVIDERGNSFRHTMSHIIQYQLVFLYVCLSIYLSICLSICLSDSCLSVFLYHVFFCLYLYWTHVINFSNCKANTHVSLSTVDF